MIGRVLVYQQKPKKYCIFPTSSQTFAICDRLLNAHSMVAPEFPHQVGLIRIAVFAHPVQHSKTGSSYDLVPQILIAHKAAELFRGDPDVLVEKTFQLTAADKAFPGQPVRA